MIDPILDTQREAYEAIKPELPNRRAEVLAVLNQLGSGTLFEVSEALRLPFHCLSGCFTGLRDRGLIADSGERRVFPKSERRHVVWIPTGIDKPLKARGRTDRLREELELWKGEALAAGKVIDALPSVAFFEPSVKDRISDFDKERKKRRIKLDENNPRAVPNPT